MKNLQSDSTISLAELTTVAANAVQSGIKETVKNGLIPETSAKIADWPSLSRGWYIEGLANGLVVRDPVNKSSQLKDLFDLAGEENHFLIYGGIGMGLAITKASVDPFKGLLPSPDGDLAFDGFGFYQSMFAQKEALVEQNMPAFIAEDPSWAMAFDQGIGRGLWFTQGGRVDRMADKIAAFPVARQAPMWMGLAFGATYAGGTVEIQQQVAEQGKAFLSHIRLGCAYACFIRAKAKAPADHTEQAAQLFAGLSADRLATILSEYLESDAHTNAPWAEVSASVQEIISP